MMLVIKIHLLVGSTQDRTYRAVAAAAAGVFPLTEAEAGALDLAQLLSGILPELHIQTSPVVRIENSTRVYLGICW